jgi:hypothetical protein
MITSCDPLQQSGIMTTIPEWDKFAQHVTFISLTLQCILFKDWLWQVAKRHRNCRKIFKIVETYWHDHSLESSWGALYEGTISFSQKTFSLKSELADSPNHHSDPKSINLWDQYVLSVNSNTKVPSVVEYCTRPWPTVLFDSFLGRGHPDSQVLVKVQHVVRYLPPGMGSEKIKHFSMKHRQLNPHKMCLPYIYKANIQHTIIQLYSTVPRFYGEVLLLIRTPWSLFLADKYDE